MPDDLRRERAWLYHKMVEVQAKLGDQGEASQAFANLVRVTIGDSGRTYAKKSLQPSRADSFG